MSNGSKPRLTKEMLESVKHLSSKKAGEALGFGKTTITEARQRYGMQRELPTREIKTGKAAKVEEKNGSLLIETVDSVPQTKDHIVERMRARGFDPEQYSFSYGFSEWEAQTPNGIQTMYSARAT